MSDSECHMDTNTKGNNHMDTNTKGNDHWIAEEDSAITASVAMGMTKKKLFSYTRPRSRWKTPLQN